MGCGAGKEAAASSHADVLSPSRPSPSKPGDSNAPTSSSKEVGDEHASYDGRWFPVVLTNGFLHVAATDQAREATLCLRLASGDRPLIPTDNVGTQQQQGSFCDANTLGVFPVPARKQKLVSYFSGVDDDKDEQMKQLDCNAVKSNAPSNDAFASIQWKGDSTVLCKYEERHWMSNRLNLVLCLVVLDSDGNRVVYEEAVNLLDGGGSSSDDEETNDEHVLAGLPPQRTITVQFTSGFSTNKVASLEFSYHILFKALGTSGNALLLLSVSPLHALYPMIYSVAITLVSALNDASMAQPRALAGQPVLPPSTDDDVLDLMEVLEVLSSSSKITFLKNKLKGKELADRYRRICKKLVVALNDKSIEEDILAKIESSANTIVNVSSQFFDNIMSARDGGTLLKSKQDVTGFLERYQESAAEYATRGVEAGESYCQLAALLCDVSGLIEPLVRAVPFGMLLVEAIGVLFKLISGRRDMLDMCDKIASRLTIFLRVLQQPDVQALLRDDSATLDACVGVYIAVDDCSECIKGFQSRNAVVQLFSAASQLAALHTCYDELQQQFSMLHHVTSMRCMAIARTHHASIEQKLEQLLSVQQTMVLSCDGNSGLLSKLVASETARQDYLASVLLDNKQTGIDLESLVENSIREAICLIATTEVHDRVRQAGLAHRSSASFPLSDEALGAIEASANEAIRSASLSEQLPPVDLAAFVSAVTSMVKSGPAIPTALRALSNESVRHIKTTTDSEVLAAFGKTVEVAFKRQTAQHKKTRAELRKHFAKLQDEMRALQNDTVTSIGERIRVATATTIHEIRTTREALQALSTAVVNPLQRIEAHIQQYTDFNAMNKPREIQPKELLPATGGGIVHCAHAEYARKALYRNRDVFVKTYDISVESAQRAEEALALFRLRHDRVVELVGTVVVSDESSDETRHFEKQRISEIVLEFLGGGALRHALDSGSSLRPTREQRLVFMYDIVTGLNFLHSQSPPRIHACLDLSNVVLSSDLRGAKLVDFKRSKEYNPSMAGASHFIDPNQLITGIAPELFFTTTNTNYGTAACFDDITRLEKLQQLCPLSVATDTYAAGTALYELWTGSIAFGGKRGKLLAKAIRDGDEPFTDADLASVPKVIRAILLGLTHSNPAKRISLGQILRMRETFGQRLLEVPDNEWRDFLPVWCSEGDVNGGATTEGGAGGESMLTLSTENIHKFSKEQLRKYLHEKEISTAIIDRIVEKGYTAKQYLRADFVFKAFPPEVRGEFDEMHLDSLAELQEFDSDYHRHHPPQQPKKLIQARRSRIGDDTNEHTFEAVHESPGKQIPSNLQLKIEGEEPNGDEGLPLGNESTCESGHMDVTINAAAHSGKKVLGAGSLRATRFLSRVQTITLRRKGSAMVSNVPTDNSNDYDTLMALSGSADMLRDGYANLNGAIITRRECFRRALESDRGGKLPAQKSQAWWLLATCMESSSETVLVGGRQVTRKQCVIHTLEHDEKHVEAWSFLTRIMAENETVVITTGRGGTREMARKNCAVEAVLCNIENPASWVTLASCLLRKERVDMKIEEPGSGLAAAIKHVSRKDCLAKAVQLCPNARHWQLLSQCISPSDEDSVTVSLNGTTVTVTKLQALVKCVECDPSLGHSWMNVVTHLHGQDDSVVVNGKRMSKKECLVEAINGGASEAYNHLGYLMERHERIAIHHGKEEVTKVLAFCRGLEQDDSSYSMWNNLGVEMIYQKMYVPQTVTIGGREMNMTDVFVCSVERDPSFGKHWNGLGISLQDDQTVTVLQRTYTRRQCYLKALSIIPNYMYAWNWLGMTLVDASDSVELNGKTFTKRQCFEQAINLGWDYAYPWWNLAMLLQQGESVSFKNMTVMTYEEVLHRAHTLYPKDKDILDRLEGLQQRRRE